jgi:hypothetical protein
MKAWAATWLAAGLATLACSPRGGAVDASRILPVPGADAAPTAVTPVDDLEPAAADDRGDAGTVTIKLLADSRRQARVFWGRKDLGIAPLEIVRPRGSAPLDLTIQAPGCLPLHTRAFTDRDDSLSLRLYSEREAAALPGYAPETSPTATTPSASTKKQR